MMLQHELKIEEVRFVDSDQAPRLYYYCICGAFSGTSFTYHHSLPYTEFFEHLFDINRSRQAVAEGGVDLLL